MKGWFNMDYDLTKVYTLTEIKQKIMSYLKNNSFYPIKKIVLFGSYARNEADGISDIDLMVFDSPDFVRLKTVQFASELKELFQKDIDLFIEKNVNKSSSFYKNIEKEGITIYE